MRSMKHSLFAFSLAISAITLAACTTSQSTGSSAIASTKEWSIDNNQSTLNFVTTKAGQPGIAGISETQVFKRFSGGVNQNGKISLNIDLASVDTGIEIRDERLRTMLWNVKATPTATFTATLPAETLNSVGSSGSQNIQLNGELQMGGQSKPVVASLRISRISDNQILVVTKQPIVINANDFGLRTGVEALREVMGLNFLAASAPVSFTLVLNTK